MPFDKELILRGVNNAAPAVLVDLVTGETAAVALAPDAKGARVVDLMETAVRGIAAVVTCPTLATGADKTLAITIEESDYVDHGFLTLVTFETLYVETTAKVVCDAWTNCVATDIGLQATISAADIGVLVAYDNVLQTMWIKSKVVIANNDAITINTGTGAGTADGDAVIVGVDTPGIHIRRFATTKRYVRGLYTVASTGNYGKVQVLLSPYPFKTL